MSTVSDPRTIPASNTGQQIRAGVVMDRSTAFTSSTSPSLPPPAMGVPVWPTVKIDVDAPPAADVDYYVTTAASGTGAKTYTLAASKPPLAVASGNGKRWIVPRNITITVAGATTWVGTVTIIDGQGRKQEVPSTNVFTGAGTQAIGADTDFGVECVEVLSIVQTSSTNNVNVTFGTGNGFGLPAPYYCDFSSVRGVLYNAAGTAFPNTPLATIGAVAGGAQQIDNLILQDLRNADGVTAIGATSAANLGLITGVVGTATPSVQTPDMKTLTEARTARYTAYRLPSNYIPGSAITIRANAGMLTTVSDGTATIDFSAYKNGAGSDLVATAATTINSLTAANKDFVVTPTGLVAGDWLDILVTIAVSDTATGTAVIGKINSLAVLPTVIASTVGENAAWKVGVPNGALSNGNSRYGLVRLGSDNTPTGTQVPDGTADFSYYYVPSDIMGVLGNDYSSTGATSYDKWIYRI